MKFRGPIVDQLKELVAQMESGDYAEASAATLITEDKETGVLTIVPMKAHGLDKEKTLFKRMAHALGYAKTQ